MISNIGGILIVHCTDCGVPDPTGLCRACRVKLEAETLATGEALGFDMGDTKRFPRTYAENVPPKGKSIHGLSWYPKEGFK